MISLRPYFYNDAIQTKYKPPIDASIDIGVSNQIRWLLNDDLWMCVDLIRFNISQILRGLQ